MPLMRFLWDHADDRCSLNFAHTCRTLSEHNNLIGEKATAKYITADTYNNVLSTLVTTSKIITNFDDFATLIELTCDEDYDYSRRHNLFTNLLVESSLRGQVIIQLQIRPAERAILDKVRIDIKGLLPLLLLGRQGEKIMVKIMVTYATENTTNEDSATIAFRDLQ